MYAPPPLAHGATACRAPQLQNAGIVTRLHVLGVHSRRQRERTIEGAVAALDAMEILFLLLFLGLVAAAAQIRKLRAIAAAGSSPTAHPDSKKEISLYSPIEFVSGAGLS